MRFLVLALIPLSATAGEIVLDNEYLRATQDDAPCAQAEAPHCVNRVIIALGDLELQSERGRTKLARGDIIVFGARESYQKPVEGRYLEVAIKPTHPPAAPPAEWVAPEKNALLFDGEDFFVFEERLAVGDTRARHSHCQRLVVQLNRTRLRQWPDGLPEKVVETTPDHPLFAAAVIHVVSNIGEAPLRGIVIEFKPRHFELWRDHSERWSLSDKVRIGQFSWATRWRRAAGLVLLTWKS